MAETTNIAKMAEKLSKELFAEFLWQRMDPTNINWPCEDVAKHKAKTHPSDVVFYYEEPYSQARTYVNCDLKSYAKGTINGSNIRSSIESLARAVSCAEKSNEWRDKYLHEHVTPEICGLLFVYNHDGEYDKDFNTLLGQFKNDKLDIPTKSKIVVLGPQDIFWLNNVRHEIILMRGGNGELPDREHCRYFYPHLVRRKNIQLDNAKASTLEMLTAPWIILSYVDPKKQNRKGFVVFYRRDGSSTEEFLYLIDYLMHYQVIVKDTDIYIKTLNAHSNAAAFFAKAKDRYVDECEGGKDIKDHLDSIKFSQINDVRTKFSDLEIGMDNG
jgi:hypothetical protein